MKNNLRLRSAFTLIELLVVIAIIGILETISP
jgi:prepilin-type N-terminal cleavage/methylation domain-containing protein